MQNDAKYSQLNKKIKDILDQDDLNNRSIQKSSQSPITRSTIFKRTESMPKEQFTNQSTIMQKREVQLNSLPNPNLYLLECLKRKNSITTEFYINVHTSILTFKQFYKLAHQCKPKTPDQAIPPPTPSKFCCNVIFRQKNFGF